MMEMSRERDESPINEAGECLSQTKWKMFESEVIRQSGDGVEGAVFGTEVKARIEVRQGRAIIFPFHKKSPLLGD